MDGPTDRHTAGTQKVIRKAYFSSLNLKWWGEAHGGKINMGSALPVILLNPNLEIEIPSNSNTMPLTILILIPFYSDTGKLFSDNH